MLYGTKFNGSVININCLHEKENSFLLHLMVKKKCNVKHKTHMNIVMKINQQVISMLLCGFRKFFPQGKHYRYVRWNEFEVGTHYPASKHIYLYDPNILILVMSIITYYHCTTKILIDFFIVAVTDLCFYKCKVKFQ